MADAAMVALRAVKINDVAVSPTNAIEALPGDRIEVELRVWGWSADVPGSRLKTYQFMIDGRGCYASGTAGLLLPANWQAPPDIVECTADSDCPSATPKCGVVNITGQNNRACLLGCGTNADCPSHYPVCLRVNSSTSRCVGNGHTVLRLERFAFIESFRPDYVHVGNGFSAVSLITSINYVFGSTVYPNVSAAPLDPGEAGALYAGTLTLDIPWNAGGTFAMDFAIPPGGIPTSGTFMVLSTPANPDGNTNVPVLTQPLTVGIVSGACCDGLSAQCSVTTHMQCDCPQCQWTEDATCEDIGCQRIPIPTASEWGLVTLALLLLIGGKLYRRSSVLKSAA